jgi:16S rRNA (adenine1518-N6/adenine1519-N6)-dimethyltransferase
MTLKPGEFHPRPKVDSMVVRIDFSPNSKQLQALPSYDHLLFTKIVRAAFSQRRKTLINTLASAGVFRLDEYSEKAELKELTGKIIEKAELEPGIRAEKLVLEDFIRLTVTAQHQLK